MHGAPDAAAGTVRPAYFLKLAWLGNPFAYMAINTFTAVAPGIARKVGLTIAEAGFKVSALQYRAYEKQREVLARRFNLLHQQYDLLVTPQLATTAFEVNHEVPPGNGMQRWWEWSPFQPSSAFTAADCRQSLPPPCSTSAMRPSITT